MKNSYRHKSHFSVSAEELFRWHEQPLAFDVLCPPWMDVVVMSSDGGVKDGNRVALSIGAGPIRVRWALRHQDHIPGVQFRDVQTDGPFGSWEHTHTFIPDSDGCTLEDRIEYSFPLRLPVPIAESHLRMELERMFEYREQVISKLVTLRVVKQMNVVVSGSRGLIGSALLPALTTQGHTVKRLVRSAPHSDQDIPWDPASGEIDVARLEGTNAVVHLAGDNIASGRWTDEKKKRLRESRIKGTKSLCEALAGMNNPPDVLICASAIGYYGDTGDQTVDEGNPSGEGFLAELCRDWEAATAPARERGIRVVNLRFGIVLSPRGGALAQMLTPFQMGAGGIIGNGRQYMSWVAIDDVAGIIAHVLQDKQVSGPVNAVSPNPVDNKEYTRVLGKVLHRPTIFPIPAFGARLVFGEMADELLLASGRVMPTKLSAAGYRFQYPDLEDALRHVLGK